MGKWNRRFLPRRNYNQDVPPIPYRTEPYPTVALPNSVPLWEQQFCRLVGSVPWHKVVTSKNYMYGHDNVIKWNDSAGEEAFQNAKQRFWAHINYLHCDIPMPDPDMYIEEVDWNPDIDPELMLDLEREYFNPDGRNDEKVKNTEQQNTHNSVSERPGNSGNNPWEENIVLNTPKDITMGCNPWEENIVLNTTKDIAMSCNPWDQSYAQGNETTHKDNPWEQGCQKGWGDSRNSEKGGNNWERKFVPCSGDSNERRWGDSGDCSWGGRKQQQERQNYGSQYLHNPSNGGWKQQQERQNYGSQYLHPRNPSNGNGGWKQQQERQNYGSQYLHPRNPSNGGCRKREGSSHQFQSSYKSSRFQGGDDSGAGHIWRKERTQKRATFGF